MVESKINHLCHASDWGRRRSLAMMVVAVWRVEEWYGSSVLTSVEGLRRCGSSSTFLEFTGHGRKPDKQQAERSQDDCKELGLN